MYKQNRLIEIHGFRYGLMAKPRGKNKKLGYEIEKYISKCIAHSALITIANYFCMQSRIKVPRIPRFSISYFYNRK